MKVSKEAIEIAKVKEQEAEDFDYCVQWKVCPKCASGLDYIAKPIRCMVRMIYKCPNVKCDFAYSK